MWRAHSLGNRPARKAEQRNGIGCSSPSLPYTYFRFPIASLFQRPWVQARTLPNTRNEMEQTTTDSQPPQPTIHIGKIIEAEVRRQHKSVTWLSNAIHCDRRNIYNIFKRESIDTELLRRISLTLNVNFFSAYCHTLDNLRHRRNAPAPYKQAHPSHEITSLLRQTHKQSKAAL